MGEKQLVGRILILVIVRGILTLFDIVREVEDELDRFFCRMGSVPVVGIEG